MRESRPRGSVRGALSNERPYREKRPDGIEGGKTMFYADMPGNGWRAVPTAEASKRYDIGKASNDSVYL